MDRLLLIFAAAALTLSLPHRAAAQEAPAQDGDTIRAFRSMDELLEFNRLLVQEEDRKLEEERQRREEEQRRREREAQRERRRNPPPPLPPPSPPPPPPPPPPPGAAAAPSGENVTNVQHAGVDEGGIVKVHGDYLVVLRRGRLFTVRIGGGDLRPVAAVDAFGPDVDPRNAWYDEILVSGPHVVVIGYSYQRGGTELGVFRISPDGALTHRATYHLRSGDYYSSRNYASRLIGDKLVFYAPLSVNPRSPLAGLPAVRRWGGADTEFHVTADPTRVYLPAGRVTLADLQMLHTVTECGLAEGDLRCRSTGLYGPPGRVFYVSPTSVYVWVTRWWGGRDSRLSSVLYRMPLDGTAPRALRVAGSPVDQFSFLESGDGHLNVLTRLDAYGEGMWGAEFAGGRLTLLRVPLTALGSGRQAAERSRYRPLPDVNGGAFQNRYVGDWLLYGTGAGWGYASGSGATAYAVRWAGDAVSELPLPHGVDRIEAMGSGAVLIGTDGRDLHFSGVRLGRGAAVPAHRYTRPGASQGETRSHGFFYRPDGEDVGVLGLPVLGPGRPGSDQLRVGSAGILFLRNRDFLLSELGTLDAGDPGGDDGCLASCVDWYGNARPLFLRGRVLALLGYELVEGREEAGRIREVRRVSFAPPPLVAALVGDWEFTEQVGQRGSRYFCQQQGTMRLDRDGEVITMRYRQTGECTVDGATTSSDGEGSGTGRVNPTGFDVRVGDCISTGTIQSSNRITGRIVCRIPTPGGTPLDVAGTWEARRAGS